MENETIYENKFPLATYFGLQPKGVKMSGKHWKMQLAYNVNEEKATKMFNIVKKI